MAFQKDTGYISVDSQILWYPAVYSWGIYILILRYIKLALFTLDSTNEKVNFLLFSRQFVPNSLQSHRLQHTRLLCPPLSSRVCSNSCLLSWWCYLTISSFSIPFFFCPWSSLAWQSFPPLCIRWPQYWSFSFSISPSNEYSGLISFRSDWFDLPAVQGTLKSLLQHHNSKASILLHEAFFMVQLSHPYMTTGKSIALTIQTFVNKVMSLLFNILSRFVIDFF